MSSPSGTTNYVANRDEIINRALRIVGAIGQGETGTTTAISEANIALNHLVKEWQADGMQLWKISTLSFTLTAGTNTYSIGIGQTAPNINLQAPNKIFQAWMRNNTTNRDQPMILITRRDYELLGDKLSQGTPNQLYYNPPGSPTGSGPQMVGTLIYYTTPDTNAATTTTAYVTGILPLDDFVADTDLPDFPSYYYNALSWGLADQLASEYGVNLQMLGFIQNKAAAHLQKALSFGPEEGSLFLQPDWQNWQNNTSGKF